MFKKQPICEICNQHPATAFVGFRPSPESNVSGWQFSCACTTRPDEARSFAIDKFFDNPAATVDKLAHLEETGTMDWHSFMEMMRRFRVATNSIGAF